MSDRERHEMEPIQPLSVQGLSALIDLAAMRERLTPEAKKHLEMITEGGRFERYATRRRLSKSIESIAEVLRGVDGVPAMVIASETNELAAKLRLAACLESRLAVLTEAIEVEKGERKRAGFAASDGSVSLSDDFKRGMLADACKAFWSLIDVLLEGPPGQFRRVDRCETGYWYCLATNALVPLYCRGLKYEQTMDGISWADDLPGQRESADREGEVFVANARARSDTSEGGADAESQPSMRGTFAVRERIGGGDVWRLNLTFGKSPTRLVLFATFRGAGPAFLKPEILTLAAYLLRGWATKHKLDLDEDSDAVWEVPTSTFRLFAESVHDWAKADQGHPVLESAISHAMRLSPEPWCHVHCIEWVKDEAWLKFRPGQYYSKGQPIEGLFKVPGAGEIAQRSVCAQSLGWNAPIFIPDMRAMTQSNVWWRDMDITCVNPDESKQVRSQIACPVQKFGSPFASISLQHRYASKLASVHVRQLGILSELLTAMIELKEESETAERWDCLTNWEWMKANLCVSGDEPTTPADLMSRYFKRVRLVLGADLAYLIAYEYSRHALGPLAVNASTRFCREYLEVRLGKGSKLGSVDAMKLIRDQDEESVFKSLVQRAMFSDLLPRRRGLSWKIAVGKQVEGVHERKVDLQKSRTRTFARDLCEERIGIPFRSRASARPEGALWVWWGRPSEGTTSSESDHRSKMERYSSDLERLGRVVATMYTLLRRRSNDIFESVATPSDADR